MNINLNNYEEWMVAFLDGELTADEQLVFNQFIKNHPELKSELADFESLLLAVDENIVFENKVHLYKSSTWLVTLKKAWPIAAAIILLLAIVPFLKNNTDPTPTIVKVQGPTPKATSPREVAPAPATIITPVEEEKKEEKSNPTNVNLVKKVFAKSSYPKKSSNTLVKEQPMEENILALKPLPEINGQGNNNSQEPEPKRLFTDEILIPQEKQIIQPPTEIIAQQKDEAKVARPIFIIDEQNNATLHHKLNDVVAQVEEKIELLNTIKNAPITVSIGKRKLFTLNN